MIKDSCQVFWTQTAQQDLKKIIEYICADNNTRARKVYHNIKQKAENLKQMPLQGRIVPELNYYGILVYREIISAPWRIVYKIEGHKLWVLAVIDGRRSVEDILFNRFF